MKLYACVQVSAVNTRAQFLVPHGVAGIGLAEASLEQAQLLNPMVEVKVEHGSVASKPDEFFSQFDAVCLTACVLEDLLKICDLCHSKSIKFFAGDAFGYHGYMFADLGQHDFVEYVHASFTLNPVWPFIYFIVKVSRIDFPWAFAVLLNFRTKKGRDPDPLMFTPDTDLLLQLRDELLESHGLEKNTIPENFTSSCFSQLSPVCPVVGGVLGQEIIKALSGHDAPLNNFFFFDGFTCNGIVDCFKSC
uniref:SUMO1 activating enzyme subunit 1 n=1 Tax=Eptatretus burgeri TaxID=7764 RepID=A0A8C4NHN2_EPTBU